MRERMELRGGAIESLPNYSMVSNLKIDMRVSFNVVKVPHFLSIKDKLTNKKINEEQYKLSTDKFD